MSALLEAQLSAALPLLFHRGDMAVLTPISQFYYRFRIFLHKRRWLLRSAQVVRGWWMLGPLRFFVIRYFQSRKAQPSLQVDRRDLFPQSQVPQVVTALNQKGYANGWTLPDEYVTRIVRYCERTKFRAYWNPHR